MSLRNRCNAPHALNRLEPVWVCILLLELAYKQVMLVQAWRTCSYRRGRICILKLQGCQLTWDN